MHMKVQAVAKVRNFEYDASYLDQVRLVQAEVPGYAYQDVSLRIVGKTGRKVLGRYWSPYRSAAISTRCHSKCEFAIAAAYALDLCSKILNRIEKRRYGLYVDDAQQQITYLTRSGDSVRIAYDKATTEIVQMRVSMVNGDEPYLVVVRRKQSEKAVDFCLMLNKFPCEEIPFCARTASQCSKVLIKLVNEYVSGGSREYLSYVRTLVSMGDPEAKGEILTLDEGFNEK